MNAGTAVGRIAAKPRVFENADGSRKVFFTLYVRRAFVSRTTNQRESDRLSFESFIPAWVEGNAVFDFLSVGMLVSVEFSVRSGQYADKMTGEVIYTTALVSSRVEILESRAQTSARRQQRSERHLASVA